MGSEYSAQVIVRGVWLEVGGVGWLREQLATRSAELGYSYLYDLTTYLTQRGINIGSTLAKLPSYHLLEIPDGDVFGVTARLFRTLGSPTLPESIEIVEPNFELRLSQLSTRIGTNFKLNGSHTSYKSALNIPPGSSIDGKDVSIAVIDTGAEQVGVTKTFIDLHDPINTTNKDSWGHGSAMVAIIHDVAPGAGIHAIRISSTGTVRIWDVTAGISTAAYDPRIKADVINLSLGFASLIGTCSVCGSSGTNRSTTFEMFLKNIGGKAGNNLADPVFVCAVGNDDPAKTPSSGFDWPARYDCTLAVGAINDARQKSSFSKTGTTKNDYVMCPGGDYDNANNDVSEWVGEGDYIGTTTKCAGTSPAAAYASGLLALYYEKFRKDLVPAGGPVSLSSSQLLGSVYTRCVKSDISNYNSHNHGHGRLVYDDTHPYP